MVKKFADVKLVTPNMHIASGEPGGGKTVLIFDIAERLHKETGKEIYVSVREEEKNVEEYKGVPKYIHSHRGFKYPLDSIVVVDDLQRIAHARRFQSNVNVYMDELHSLLRHHNIDFLYDTQSLVGIDKNNILRSNYRWYKKPYQLEAAFGRREVEDEVSVADEALKGKGKTYAYLCSKVYNGVVDEIPKPGWWTEEFSTLHRRDESLGGKLRQRYRRII